jgi:hypothetical protein
LTTFSQPVVALTPADAVPGETYYWSITATASDTNCTGNCIGGAVAGWLEITVT